MSGVVQCDSPGAVLLAGNLGRHLVPVGGGQWIVHDKHPGELPPMLLATGHSYPVVAQPEPEPGPQLATGGAYDEGLGVEFGCYATET